MNNSTNPTEVAQPASRQSDQNPSTVECLGCPRELSEKNTVVSYHADEPESSLISGYLCPVCRERIETILDHDPEECDECGAPLPQAGRMDVSQYDDEGHTLVTDTLCFHCLLRRYTSR
ncbi:hypothetical protein ACKVMT_05380 [Halobacteriales archaeon Cl-PHB]